LNAVRASVLLPIFSVMHLLLVAHNELYYTERETKERWSAIEPNTIAILLGVI